MPATVIPVTGLNLGPVGAVSQSDFPLRTPRQVNPTDTNSIAFGETVVLNSNNTYSSLKTFVQGVTAGNPSVLPTTPIGLAAANTRTNGTFPLAGTAGATTPGGSYAPGNIADVLTQGTMNVQLNNGTPVAGGTVYVRVAANPSIPAGVVGGIEAALDASVNTTGTWSNNSPNITLASGANVVVGQIVSGAGIPPGSAVLSINGTALVISQNTTAAGSATPLNFASTVPNNYMKFKTGVVGSDNTTQVTIPNRVMP